MLHVDFPVMCRIVTLFSYKYQIALLKKKIRASITEFLFPFADYMKEKYVLAKLPYVHVHPILSSDLQYISETHRSVYIQVMIYFYWDFRP